MRGGRALTAAGSCRGASYPLDGQHGDHIHIGCTLEERSPASSTSTSMIQKFVTEIGYTLVGLLGISVQIEKPAIMKPRVARPGSQA